MSERLSANTQANQIIRGVLGRTRITHGRVQDQDTGKSAFSRWLHGQTSKPVEPMPKEGGEWPIDDVLDKTDFQPLEFDSRGRVINESSRYRN